MFGGEHIVNVNSSSLLNDVWVFNPTTNDWKIISNGGCHVYNLFVYF